MKNCIFQIWTTIRLFNDSIDIGTTATFNEICIRSGWSIVLLLVNGCIVGFFIQFLGDNLSVFIPRDKYTNNYCVVLLRLFFGFSIFSGYFISFSYRLLGRWCFTNRLNKITTTLYEFNDILY